jgi:hypothetical protein
MREMSGWNYSDQLLWNGFSDQLPLSERGKVEPARAAQIVNAYALAFFDRHLKGEEVPLLDGPSSDYPEVELETRNM